MNSTRPAGLSLWLLALSAFLFLILLPLTRQGMFMDGVFYAAIAKNLSLGYGSLWQPFYSHTDFPVFYEHPPLALYFQSLFFKGLGQGFGVERLYCLLMAVGQFALIACYWQKKQRTSATDLGLLLLLWLMTPLNHMYVSNHLEATLTLFTTFASLVLLIPTKTTLSFFIQYSVSAVAIFIAFFCNGPTALFPLVVPFFHRINNKHVTLVEGIKHSSFLITLTAIVLIGFFIAIPESLLNTKHYFEQQLLPAVIGSRQLDYVGIYHLNILFLCLRAYWFVTIFVFGCLYMASKIKRIGFKPYARQALKNKEFVFFFTLSLISSLPISISHKQAFSYIMPSAPFYILAMMSLCFDSFKTIYTHLAQKRGFYQRLTQLSYVIFFTSLLATISLANGFNRHQTMIEDIQYISEYCKPNTILSTSSDIYSNWYTSAYLARYSTISVTTALGHEYYLGLKNAPIPKHYQTVNVPLSYYTLAELEHRHLGAQSK